jgi:hypothetical protein
LPWVWKAERVAVTVMPERDGGQTTLAIKDPRPKGRGLRRRDGEPFSCSGEPDVGLADASNLRRKRRECDPKRFSATEPWRLAPKVGWQWS